MVEPTLRPRSTGRDGVEEARWPPLRWSTPFGQRLRAAAASPTIVAVSADRRAVTSRSSTTTSASSALVGRARLVILALVVATSAAACGSRSSASRSAGRSGAHSPPATGAADVAAPAKPPPPTHTSCGSVVYIGDSTSDGEALADYVPNPRLRLQAQLAKVGVSRTIPEVSGARSIVETWHGFPNAATVAKQHISEGFHGCWILALGTNDTADVQAGSSVGLSARIARMMAIIGPQPVMWVNVLTLVHSSPYTEDAMLQWNNDLLVACQRYPLMRVFDWAAHAKPGWFIPDGIHYTPAGYAIRTRLIAHALVKAFPKDGSPSSSCLVR